VIKNPKLTKEEQEIDSAIDCGEFTLVFTPKMSAQYAALGRWSVCR